jgi:predicted nucleic acid-binding protein
MILLDTCVVSEGIKPGPDPRLLAWIDSLDEDNVYLCAFTIAELQKGVEKLEKGKKQDALRLWIEQLRARFNGKVLTFDVETAAIWGDLTARVARQGQNCPLMDTLIAAVALRHDALLATRNEADFVATGVKTINPWAP